MEVAPKLHGGYPDHSWSITHAAIKGNHDASLAVMNASLTEKAATNALLDNLDERIALLEEENSAQLWGA